MKALKHLLAVLAVRHRNYMLPLIAVIAAACAFLSLKVEINSDMTKYLPDKSAMKQGIDLMAEELGELTMPRTIRVMLKNLPEDETDDIIDLDKGE